MSKRGAKATELYLKNGDKFELVDMTKEGRGVGIALAINPNHNNCIWRSRVDVHAVSNLENNFFGFAVKNYLTDGTGKTELLTLGKEITIDENRNVAVNGLVTTEVAKFTTAFSVEDEDGKQTEEQVSLADKFIPSADANKEILEAYANFKKVLDKHNVNVAYDSNNELLHIVPKKACVLDTSDKHTMKLNVEIPEELCLVLDNDVTCTSDGDYQWCVPNGKTLEDLDTEAEEDEE